MSCPDVASVGVLELALEDLVVVAGLGQLGEGIVEGQVNDLKRKKNCLNQKSFLSN